VPVQPLTIVVILLSVEALVLSAAAWPPLKKVFSVLPPLFWIYFLPMVLATTGLLPARHPVYEAITTTLLPAGLILILLPVNLRNIFKLGGQALTIMLAGSLGIILGAPLVILIFKPWMPADIWKGFGALSGSWIGGSSNMLAIKEAIGTPEDIFFLMVIMDTVVVYLWMATLIALSNVQEKFDRWNRARVEPVKEIAARVATENSRNLVPQVRHLAGILAIALAGSWLSFQLGQTLPEMKNLLAPFTWTVIIASLLGILLSETPLREIESYGASRLGYLMLFLVLASIGARGNLSRISQAPLLVIAGFLWVFIHAGVLVLTGRLLRAPLCLLATASQANLGGPASAPVVAEAYQPGLAPVGVLMAILGLLLGTFLGLLCCQLCRLVAS